MRLFGPDGQPRKQIRTITLAEDPKQPGVLAAAGLAKSPRKFPLEAGWTIENYKYRAYYTHPGLHTNSSLPEWLKASIARQQALWNRLAWLCRDARRRCSQVKVDELRQLVNETILVTLDQFNNSLGRSKEKIRHPAKLKVAEPDIGGLWNFIGSLRKRVKKQRPVPDGMLETLVAFAKQFAPDYGPLNEFQRTFVAMANNEADKLGLLWYERKTVIQAFKAALKARVTNHSPFSDGWPQIRYPDDPRAGDWCLHFPMKRPDIPSESLESKGGIPGLSFGPPIPASKTSHPTMLGIASRRQLREAEISLRTREKGRRQFFRFGVLQHRPLPAGAHIKGWKLVAKDHALWLSITVERQCAVAVPKGAAAGLDIGWRRTKKGVRFGTLYEPSSGTVRELVMDFQHSPGNQGDRVPFHIDLGPTRWESRSLVRLLPGWRAETQFLARLNLNVPPRLRLIKQLKLSRRSSPDYSASGCLPG